MPVDGLDLVAGESQVLQCTEALLDLRPTACADQCTRHRGLGEHPRERHLRETLSTLPGDLVERAYVAKITFGEHGPGKGTVLSRPRCVRDAIQVFCGQ